MSQDQAAGLRQWADTQRLKQAQATSDAPLEAEADEETQVAETQAAEIQVAETEAEKASEALAQSVFTPPLSMPELPERPLIKPKKTLFIVGLPGHGVSSINQVKRRLAQWAELGRHWAGDPDDWAIHVVKADASELSQLSAKNTRWALWVNSEADAFAQMYRVLRQARENGGPRQLLALHEPHLPRQGLLSNLREAAAHYLATDLLLLAR